MHSTQCKKQKETKLESLLAFPLFAPSLLVVESRKCCKCRVQRSQTGRNLLQHPEIPLFPGLFFPHVSSTQLLLSVRATSNSTSLHCYHPFSPVCLQEGSVGVNGCLVNHHVYNNTPSIILMIIQAMLEALPIYYPL